MRLDQSEVVIIGGGVSGLSSAWWLAKTGVQVIVVERGVIGYEASSRNGGICGVRGDGSVQTGLSVEAAQLWPTMDEALGYPTEYAAGYLSVALDEAAMATLIETRPGFAKLGIATTVLDSKTVREFVPLISPHVVGGLFNPKWGHANPQRTVQAYAWAAQDSGAKIYQHTTVTGFKIQGDKVTAVETSRGDIAADFVISAAGPQTAILADLVGAFIPLAPARVEIVITAPVPPMYPGAVSGNGLYGRQTKRGNLAYGGGPHEWTEITDMRSPNKPNSPIIRNIARRIYELFEGAGDVTLIRAWAGVVEQAPDYQPIFEVLDNPSNYMVVSLSSSGFARSPATGKVVSELVLHRKTSVNIDGLHLGRFAELPRDWRQQRHWDNGQYNT
jgi:sarcosine oxidase subunit beta